MTPEPTPTVLRLPGHVNGPPSSGNGGWSAGALAELLERLEPGAGPITVRLQRPPPLETDLQVVRDGEPGGWLEARHDGAVVLRARRTDQVLRPVAPVGAATARAAEASYAGLGSHPFGTCVVCGTERADGMRIFPGRVDDHDGAARVAATWTPRETTTPATWAALDCIGGWAGDLGERLMVLGTLTLQVLGEPDAGVEHVVVGGDRGSEGRKTRTAASLYAADGSLLATADHTWLAVDPKAFA